MIKIFLNSQREWQAGGENNDEVSTGYIIFNKQSSWLQREFLLPLKLRNRYPGTWPLFTPILKKMGVLERVVIG
ncbi:hypothetical protein EXN04_09720 [Clostridium botulinum]|nr:hypothetical protein [Clostridium botulinum]